jgi:two-component system nitrate/nitrite response regulator NarL
VEGATALREAEPLSPILCVNIDGLQYTLLRSQSKHNCHLSPQESEIVRLVAEGMPNKCISTVLQISSWTVATHLRRIFAKLGVTSRAAMVARVRTWE